MKYIFYTTLFLSRFYCSLSASEQKPLCVQDSALSKGLLVNMREEYKARPFKEKILACYAAREGLVKGLGERDRNDVSFYEYKKLHEAVSEDIFEQMCEHYDAQPFEKRLLACYALREELVAGLKDNTEKKATGARRSQLYRLELEQTYYKMRSKSALSLQEREKTNRLVQYLRKEWISLAQEERNTAFPAVQATQARQNIVSTLESDQRFRAMSTRPSLPLQEREDAHRRILYLRKERDLAEQEEKETAFPHSYEELSDSKILVFPCVDADSFVPKMVAKENVPEHEDWKISWAERARIQMSLDTDESNFVLFGKSLLNVLHNRRLEKILAYSNQLESADKEVTLKFGLFTRQEPLLFNGNCHDYDAQALVSMVPGAGSCVATISGKPSIKLGAGSERSDLRNGLKKTLRSFCDQVQSVRDQKKS